MIWENLREEEFKSAVEVSNGLCVIPIGCLEMLFGPNFAKENDKVMVEDEDKLYFSLDFPEDESFQPPAQLGIGKKADYMFPQ